MKKYLFIMIVMLNMFQHSDVNAQAPSWLWANRAGGAGNDSATCIASDASGNVFVTGYFESTSVTFGSTTLVNAGVADLFVVKYDGSGNVVWARSAGGTGSDKGTGIIIDVNGNVLVTGSFTSATITFGSTTLTNAGGSDMLTVKYDGSGNVLWAKSVGAVAQEGGTAITTNSVGSVIVTGTFSSASITLGSQTLNNTSAGFYDIILVYYNSSGTALFARSAGGTTHDYSTGITTDAAGNMFMTGNCMSTSSTFGTSSLNGPGIFTVKYNGNGTVAWARNASNGGVGSAGNSICTDTSGNVYVTGYFTSVIITMNNITLNNPTPPLRDMLVVKYNNIGAFRWLKRAGSTDSEAGNGIATDVSGSVFVTGYFASPSIAFGTDTLTNVNPSTGDIFIAKYDTSGNALWGIGIGGINDDYATSIRTNASGEIMVSGAFRSATIPFGTTILTNGGGGLYDMFAAKLGGMTTGAEENNFSEEVLIFPNPFSSQAVLHTGMLHNAMLTVENIFGQRVREIKNIYGQSITLQRGDLPGGLYFIRLSEDNKIIATKKIVVTH